MFVTTHTLSEKTKKLHIPFLFFFFWGRMESSTMFDDCLTTLLLPNLFENRMGNILFFILYEWGLQQVKGKRCGIATLDMMHFGCLSGFAIQNYLRYTRCSDMCLPLYHPKSPVLSFRCFATELRATRTIFCRTSA